jgi:hypothetical protein
MLAFLLAALIPFSRARASDADAWLGKDRAALFESWVKDLEDGVPRPGRGAERLGSTWDMELSRARRRALEARTKEDVYYALLSLKNALHDGHGGLSAPEGLMPEQARYRSPLRFRPERAQSGLSFVVSESTAAQAGLGLVLVGVDGLAPERAMGVFREWHRTSSPEHMEFEFAHWLSTRYSYDQPLPSPLEIRYELRDPATGKTSSVTLPFSRHGHDFDEEEPLSAYRYPIAEDYRGWEPVFSGLNYRVYADDAHGALVLRVFSFNYRFDSAGLWSRMVGLSYKPRALPSGL